MSANPPKRRRNNRSTSPATDSTEKPSPQQSEAAEPGKSTPTTSPSETAAELNALAADLRRTIHAISGQCHSRIRAIIDRYPACINATPAEQGDVGFPRPLRPHPRDGERGRLEGKSDLLCFHIGNAIKALQDARNGSGAVAKVRSRTTLLREMAKQGVREFVVYGSDAHGFMLVHRDAAAKLRTRDE